MGFRSALCAAALVAAAGFATAGTAIAAEPAGNCDFVTQPGCGQSGHANAGRGNGSELLGTKVDQDPGNSAGHNNGGD